MSSKPAWPSPICTVLTVGVYPSLCLKGPGWVMSSMIMGVSLYCSCQQCFCPFSYHKCSKMFKHFNKNVLSRTNFCLLGAVFQLISQLDIASHSVSNPISTTTDTVLLNTLCWVLNGCLFNFREALSKHFLSWLWLYLSACKPLTHRSRKLKMGRHADSIRKVNSRALFFINKRSF